MSTLAVLLLLLGGVGYAATQLPKNSVTSKTIKDGQVKTKDLGIVSGGRLQPDSVTGSQIAEGTLAGVARGSISNGAASAAGSTDDVVVHSVPGYGEIQLLCQPSATAVGVKYLNTTGSSRYLAEWSNADVYVSDLIPSGGEMRVTSGEPDGGAFLLDISETPGSSRIAHFSITVTAGGSVPGLPDLCYGTVTAVVGPGD